MFPSPPTALTRFVLTLLRMAIGWHLLYEGIVKIEAAGWTSAEYLAGSTWLLSGYFRRMAESPGLLRAVDLLNIWGLTLIGAALVMGVLTRTAAFLGAVLLGLYYLANPPFVGAGGMVGEGNYLIVNKNLVEAFGMLLLLAAPKGWMLGVDSLLAVRRRRQAALSREGRGGAAAGPGEGEAAPPRRELLRHLIGFPVLGALGYALYHKRRWESLEEKYLLAQKVDATTSATLKHLNYARLSDLKGTMSYGRIGNLKVSRLILGGNLIGGWAHSRDLTYVSDLVLAYHTDDRVISTFRLAEKCGVNTFLTHPKLLRIIRKYWREYGGTIQYIADCGGGGELLGMVRLAIDAGAHACYVQGATADRLVQEGKLDEIRQALETTRAAGLPAGIGAHRIETIKACVAAGIRPDFWMKTLHHHNYWSAGQSGGRDNTLYSIFCPDPQETIEVMRQLPEPWIAFKVLAAGAIAPSDGFAYAFRHGADFLCVGMYDFQLVQDVNIACQTLAALSGRDRPWCA